MKVLEGASPLPAGPLERLNGPHPFGPCNGISACSCNCMFSEWIEAFPCREADAATVAKKLLENIFLALAAVAQWIKHWTANQRVASWIPRQGTCLACEPSCAPPVGGVREATTH